VPVAPAEDKRTESLLAAHRVVTNASRVVATVPASDKVERYVLQAVRAAEAVAPATTATGRYAIVLLGDAGELTSGLLAAASALEPAPIVHQIVAGTKARQLAGNRYEADLSTPESIRQVRALLMGSGDVRVGGVVNCLGLSEPFASSDCDDEQLPLQASLCALEVIKELLEDLEASRVEGGGWLLNVTRLGGKFGLEGPPESRLSLAAAGSLGIVKTLAREHPKLLVRNIDVDPALGPTALVELLVREGALHGPAPDAVNQRVLEIGLTREGRWKLELQKKSLPAAPGALPLGPESVVLVLGGAQGVTASISKAVAATGCRVIIAGLSHMPDPEPAEIANLERPELRQRLISQAQESGRTVLPADIERQVNRILKDRQIRATLSACEAAGAQVEYHTMDARDAGKFGAFLDGLYERFGRIDGVVHGAGVIEDKLLHDKTAESFTKVFTTKVASALTLVRKLRPEGLKFLVFFSSVTARFGNPGQSDYSAANEVLNKLASDLGRRWPARVVSINWGPWDGGMVSEPTRDLRQSYAQMGIGLMSIADGAAACLAELSVESGGPADVLISTSVPRMIALAQQTS
jgi:NAD(P)-dependent dehydrogenase (short-subunit alcohol dehydrogenase family)